MISTRKCSRSSSTSTSPSRRTSSRALFTDGETQLGQDLRPGVGATGGEHPPGARLRARQRGHQRPPRIGASACATAGTRRSTLDHACDAEMDICMTFNRTGESLIRHGFAREIDVDEGLDLLQQAQEQNLVQFGENVQRRVNFICNCCGCCCEAMNAPTPLRLAQPDPHHQLPARDRSRALQRLHEVRSGLPGRGHGHGLGQRSRASQAAPSQAG